MNAGIIWKWVVCDLAGRIKRRIRLLREMDRYGIEGDVDIDISVQGIMINKGSMWVSSGTRIRIAEGGKMIVEDGNHYIGVGCYIDVPRGCIVRLGKGVNLQDYCYIMGSVEVGEGSIMGPFVYMNSGSHVVGIGSGRDAIEEKDKRSPIYPEEMPIRIEKDCFIGIRAILLRGVTIKRGVVVGAGSLITQRIRMEEYDILAGVPAEKIGKR